MPATVAPTPTRTGRCVRCSIHNPSLASGGSISPRPSDWVRQHRPFNASPRWLCTLASSLPLVSLSRPSTGRLMNFRLPTQATQIAAKRLLRISKVPDRVALLIPANTSDFVCPTLRKKSLGGSAGGTYPKIRVTPSTPTASSHHASSSSMIFSWDFLMFFPMRLSEWGSRAMMLPSRSAIRIEPVGGSTRSLR